MIEKEFTVEEHKENEFVVINKKNEQKIATFVNQQNAIEFVKQQYLEYGIDARIELHRFHTKEEEKEAEDFFNEVFQK